MIDHQQIISSDQNPKFKLWKSLLLSKNRKKESMFILSGQKILADFIAEKGPANFSIKAVLQTKTHDDRFLNLLKAAGYLEDRRLFFTLDTLLFKELDVLGTDYPLLICERPTDKTATHLDSPVGLELGLPLTDPSNLGALCRTALSFNVTKIILTPGACDPYHPKALRASSGATLKLDIIYQTAIETAADPGDYCLDLQGQNIYNFIWPKNLRLWLGEEGQGFKRIFEPKNRIHIPIKGVESLNATVAGSIAIFSYSQRFNKI